MSQFCTETKPRICKTERSDLVRFRLLILRPESFFHEEMKTEFCHIGIVFAYLLLAVQALPFTVGPNRITRIITDVDIIASNIPEQASNPTVRPASTGTEPPFTPRGISHHGGPVIGSGTNVYVDWYGAWESSSQDIIRNFLHSLEPGADDSDGTVRGWWNIHSMYYSISGDYIDPTLYFRKEVSDSYSQGSSLTTLKVAMSIINSIFSGKLPFDENGIYLLLSSPDVKVEEKKRFICYFPSYSFDSCLYPFRSKAFVPPSVVTIHTQ